MRWTLLRSVWLLTREVVRSNAITVKKIPKIRVFFTFSPCSKLRRIKTAYTKSVLITTIIKSRKIYWFFSLCCAMDWGYKGWNAYRERRLAIFIKYFCLERTNQLNLLPDKDLADFCPLIESYQVTKNR